MLFSRQYQLVMNQLPASPFVHRRFKWSLKNLVTIYQTTWYHVMDVQALIFTGVTVLSPTLVILPRYYVKRPAYFYEGVSCDWNKMMISMEEDQNIIYRSNKHQYLLILLVVARIYNAYAAFGCVNVCRNTVSLYTLWFHQIIPTVKHTNT